jgi:hypothetical protein
MLALVVMIVGLFAAVVVGPGGLSDLVVSYVIPTLVILGVVVGTIYLVVWEGGKVYDTRYPHLIGRLQRTPVLRGWANKGWRPELLAAPTLW